MADALLEPALRPALSAAGPVRFAAGSAWEGGGRAAPLGTGPLTDLTWDFFVGQIRSLRGELRRGRVAHRWIGPDVTYPPESIDPDAGQKTQVRSAKGYALKICSKLCKR
jgi:hypothetical protein